MDEHKDDSIFLEQADSAARTENTDNVNPTAEPEEDSVNKESTPTPLKQAVLNDLASIPSKVPERKRKATTDKEGKKAMQAQLESTAMSQGNDTHTQIAKLNRLTYDLQKPKAKPGEDVEDKPRSADQLEIKYAHWHLYCQWGDIDKKDETTWPTKNTHLQDWHVWRIIEAGISKAKRTNLWPADFGSMGMPRPYRSNKGRAAKMRKDEDGKLYYVCIGESYNLCGDEGSGKVSRHLKNKTSGNAIAISFGPPCVIQNDFTPDHKELVAGIHPRRFGTHEAKRQKMSDPAIITPEPPLSNEAQLKAHRAFPYNSEEEDDTPSPLPKMDYPLPSVEKGNVVPSSSNTPTTSEMAASTTVDGGGLQSLLSSMLSKPADKEPRPLKFAKRHTSARSDFFESELALLLRNQMDHSEWTQAATKTIKDSIVNIAVTEHEEDFESSMTAVHDQLQHLIDESQAYLMESSNQMYARADEAGIDMKSIEKKLRLLNERYPLKEYDNMPTGIIDPPPPLLKAIKESELQETAKGALTFMGLDGQQDEDDEGGNGSLVDYGNAKIKPSSSGSGTSCCIM